MTTINNNLTIEQMREIVSKAPANAESYQGGYYFRESPQFMFHNGFHDQWNLTDNDGLYFRAAGFHPVRIDDLRTAIATATQSDAIAKHDEFKVGDFVVRRAGLDRELHKIEIVKDLDIKIFSQDMSHSFWAFRGLFKHATPEEIKAGRRLEAERHG